jgi:elongation factor Ts
MATVTITAEQVKQLRDKTGAGMMECKAALTEAGGDQEKAVDILRKKGSRRPPSAPANHQQGVVGSYIHRAARSACRGGELQRPTSSRAPTTSEARGRSPCTSRPPIPLCRREDVRPSAGREEIYRAQFADSGKPPAVVEKIVEGKLGSFYSQIVLIDQPSVRDPNVTVSQLIAQASAKTGENITVSRFARFKVGEHGE